MKKSINVGLLMDFFINMGFINSDSPFINGAKMIYQLPYLYICVNGRGLSRTPSGARGSSRSGGRTDIRSRSDGRTDIHFRSAILVVIDRHEVKI